VIIFFIAVLEDNMLSSIYSVANRYTRKSRKIRFNSDIVAAAGCSDMRRNGFDEGHLSVVRG
jgi:hypothetical protein